MVTNMKITVLMFSIILTPRATKGLEMTRRYVRSQTNQVGSASD